jgi:hypothetical protein
MRTFDRSGFEIGSWRAWSVWLLFSASVCSWALLCLTLRYSRIDGWCTYLDYVSSSAVSLGGESDEICTPVH